VFLELRDKHNIQFSFSDQAIQNCYISKNKSYASPEEAIKDLLKGCQLIYKKSGAVFIILPVPKKQEKTRHIPEKKIYTFSGKILDVINKETLPFAALQYQNKGISSNPNGGFSFKTIDSLVHLKISYVGYYQIDTLLSPSSSHSIKLTPAVLGLKEILIKSSNPIVFDMHVGQSAGTIKINHQLTSFLAGNRNNTIYNILRLQAGVMAAGEQTSDYTIWGSYQGQNLVSFDNITLFNISSFDDNISAVNPLIVKEIEVKKGGFNAEYSNRVGGIVSITGKDGNYEKFSGDLNINNQALSGIINTPIANRFALQTSFRQSFANVFPESNDNENDFLKPKFNFRDMNVKLSGKINKTSDFYLSLMGSNDESEYEFLKDERRFVSSFTSKSQEKKQNGAALSYTKQIKSGASTNLILSYSKLNTKIENEIYFKSPRNDEDDIENESYTSNGIKEFSAKTIHYFSAKSSNQFTLGADFTYNSSHFVRDTSTINLRRDEFAAQRVGGFVNDNISISKKVNLQMGLRFDLMENITKAYLQPRIKLSFEPHQKWKINLAYGVYNQFITKNNLIDNLNNYLYIWQIADNKRIPVLSSQHYTLGLTHNSQNIKFSLEGFYKETDNITLYFYNLRQRGLDLNVGKSKTLGLDAYFKMLVKKHEFWLAYTLSQTVEKFSYFQDNQYQTSPHNQSHELKGAGVLNFSPFYLSLNYVYGSGLEFTKTIENTSTTIPYKRLDLAILYKFNTQKFNADISFSILNLLNTKNIRYDDFTNFPDGKRFYSKSTPFTPLLNLHIGF
jgi:outer membrane receptor for ferrienterochelin and colicin